MPLGLASLTDMRIVSAPHVAYRRLVPRRRARRPCFSPPSPPFSAPPPLVPLVALPLLPALSPCLRFPVSLRCLMLDNGLLLVSAPVRSSPLI